MTDPRREHHGANSPANKPVQGKPHLRGADRLEHMYRPAYSQCVRCGRHIKVREAGSFCWKPMGRTMDRSKGKLWGGKPGVSRSRGSCYTLHGPNGPVCGDVTDCRRARRAGHRYKPKDYSDMPDDPDLTTELRQALAAPPVADAAFHRLVGWSMSELKLTDREVAREFSCALPTVRRWREGVNFPHEIMRPHVLQFFLDKALAAGEKKE